MWFEILPSAGIIFVAMAVPHFSAYVINKVTIGNMYRRNLVTENARLAYLRDRHLTGNPYKLKGLEGIPDA